MAHHLTKYCYHHARINKSFRGGGGSDGYFSSEAYFCYFIMNFTGVAGGGGVWTPQPPLDPRMIIYIYLFLTITMKFVW